MAKLGYTVELKIESMARAYGRELPISWKKAIELARALRGKKVEKALEYLDNVISLKQAVPFHRYKRWVAHKSGVGPARYPVKAAPMEARKATPPVTQVMVRFPRQAAIQNFPHR